VARTLNQFVRRGVVSRSEPMRNGGVMRSLLLAASPVFALWLLLLPPMNGGRGQTPGPEVPPLLIESMAGEDLFRAYCSPCHGAGARGDGPISPALRSPPPDLTTLARRNGGRYPSDRVLTAISGEPQMAVLSHGTTDMPVWGPIFRQLGGSEEEARQRVLGLVRYLESIQGQ